jgi:hypothetical protein
MADYWMVEHKAPYHKKRIKNNQLFIVEANMAIDILIREQERLKI